MNYRAVSYSMPSQAMPMPRKLIYIMGSANCGSTLLTSVLSRHSEIATVGELKMSAIPDYQNYTCGCGVEFLECDFWKQVVDYCKRQNESLDLGNVGTHYRVNDSLTGKIIGTQVRSAGMEALRSIALHLWPNAKNQLTAVHRRNGLIIDAVCTILNRPVFVDESKDPVRLMHLYRSGLFDIRAIHMVRDGRAVFASYKKRSPDMAGNFHLWKDKVEECEQVKARLPSLTIKEVKYEDFCTNTVGILREIEEFCGIEDKAETCIDPNFGNPQHIIGHDSRLHAGSPIRLRSEWQTSLTIEELASFNRLGAVLNAKFGYH
jgi:hypothetical protein